MSANAFSTLVLLLCASAPGASAQSLPPRPTPAQPVRAQAAPPLLSLLTDELIRDAVRATLAVPADNPRRHEVDTIRGSSYAAFAAQFSEARVPSCLHPDGLSLQPTSIGPIAVSGLLAAPMVMVALARGKCN